MSIPVHIVSVHFTMPVSLIDDSPHTVLDFPACLALGKIMSEKHFNLQSIWFNIHSEFHRSERKYSLYILAVYSATVLPSSEPNLHLCMCWLDSLDSSL